MISLPSIVLIDDTKEELEKLQESFNLAGYPYFPIHYKNAHDNTTGLDHVNLGMIKPRIIITDLNLQEGTVVEAKTLVGPIAEVLKTLNVDGPYLLYFWSKNGRYVKDVINLIIERHKDIPCPIHWGVLEKSEFISEPEKLKARVQEIFSEDPIFHALFNWENRVSSAAQATTDSLFNLAKPSSPEDIDDFKSKTTNKLQTMLAVIGNETLGTKNAKEEPEVAIEQGLEPVLLDHIRSNYKLIDSDIWLTAASGIGAQQTTEKSVKAQLNSFYHVEKLEPDAAKDKRGTWVALSSAYFEDTKNAGKIINNLGQATKAILHEEFLDNRQGSKAERDNARNATKLGFIELSAECDQAQRKTKLHKYFLSAMIPIEYEPFTFFGDEQKRVTAHDGIYRLPNVVVDGQEYIVKISFRYQVGTKPDFNKWLGNPVFKLKDQILTDISFRASQHAARPGIIRFD